MQTKLTLRMDDQLIKKAKNYSQQTGRSLSRIVSDYFALLDTPAVKNRSRKAPKVAKLRGALSGMELDQRTYNRHLEEKYQ